MIPREPRLFSIIRKKDESGVSGNGRVLDGVVFHNGKTVVCWRTDTDCSKHGYSSIAVYDDFEAFFYIHVSSHPKNKTEIIWRKRNGGKEKNRDRA